MVPAQPVWLPLLHAMTNHGPGLLSRYCERPLGFMCFLIYHETEWVLILTLLCRRGHQGDTAREPEQVHGTQED